MDKPKGLQGISVPVFLLVMLFAMSSWIDYTGVFVELPLLLTRLPEGWALLSYSALACDMASVGPFLYILAVKLCPFKIKDWPVIYVIIGVGCAMTLCLVFLWDKTVSVGGQQRSVYFLTIVSALSLVDCTSSVVYIPYMARFKTQYLSAYFIGEGLGFLIPSLVALGQGLGYDEDCVNMSISIVNETMGGNFTGWKLEPLQKLPLFSVEIYFLVLFLIMVLSGISFTVLHVAPFCKKEYEQHSPSDDKVNAEDGNNNLELLGQQELDEDQVTIKDHEAPTQEMSTRVYRLHLVLTLIIAFFVYGILTSVISYSTLPYGSVPLNIMVKLAAAGGMIAGLLNLFYSASSLASFVGLTAVSLLFVAYHVFLACHSPYPPLQGTLAGSLIAVSTGVMSYLIGLYTLYCIGSSVKIGRGKTGLLWYGFCNQIGSTSGTLLMFVNINVLELFKDKAPCE